MIINIFYLHLDEIFETDSKDTTETRLFRLLMIVSWIVLFLVTTYCLRCSLFLPTSAYSDRKCLVLESSFAQTPCTLFPRITQDFTRRSSSKAGTALHFQISFFFSTTYVHHISCQIGGAVYFSFARSAFEVLCYSALHILGRIRFRLRHCTLFTLRSFTTSSKRLCLRSSAFMH